MSSFSILSFVKHFIAAILAGLGSVTTEWVPPVNRKSTED
jgi:hypothetical protein